MAQGFKSQMLAAECFRSKAELLFARFSRRCFRSRHCCCSRLRATELGFFSRYRVQYSGFSARHLRELSRHTWR